MATTLTPPALLASTVTAPDQIKSTLAIGQGPAGASGGPGGAYLMTASRLAEFDTDEAKADARANLGLQTIDGGTFF